MTRALCQTYKTTCPICKEKREVIQRYKALPFVTCELCKRKKMNKEVLKRYKEKNAYKTSK